jgi:translocation and assembly module TamB
VEGRATLSGEKLLLANLPEARLAASPDLRFHYSGRDLAIGGEVDIPFARITQLGGATAISASPDEVLVGARVPDEKAGLQVTSRVRVSVGPDVQINAAGLRGSVEGSILTVIQPRTLPWGRGELRVVDGTFGVFGQRLEIQTGRLIYTGGPLENPGLEIRAVRRIDEVTAGALVRGTLQQPEISVYSDPPMPRTEALSYLTLGRSLADLQSSEQRTVNQAANSLALSGGNLIAQDLGKRLGFDQVYVAADGNGEGASLVVSRYIGGGIYVGYGIGLFDTVNTLRLRFQVNKRLSLETVSGEEHAGDLFYTFERD